MTKTEPEIEAEPKTKTVYYDVPRTRGVSILLGIILGVGLTILVLFLLGFPGPLVGGHYFGTWAGVPIWATHATRYY